MWATTLIQFCGPPFLPKTPLQEAENIHAMAPETTVPLHTGELNV